MFSYSYQKDGPWLGEFPNASSALIAGRANLDPTDAPTVFVARWREAHYSDLFIGAPALLSYMREDATEKMTDNDLAAFDSLLAIPAAINELTGLIETVIGEWEAMLPGSLQLRGMWVDQVRGYRLNEEVRPGHFPVQR